MIEPSRKKGGVISTFSVRRRQDGVEALVGPRHREGGIRKGILEGKPGGLREFISKGELRKNTKTPMLDKEVEATG